MNYLSICGQDMVQLEPDWPTVTSLTCVAVGYLLAGAMEVTLLCDLSASSRVAPVCPHTSSRVERKRLEVCETSGSLGSELSQDAIGQSKPQDQARLRASYPYYS